MRGSIIFLLVATSACGQSALPECFVHFPVYDPDGLRQAGFAITSVKVLEPEGSAGTEILNLPAEAQPVVARGDRLYFEKRQLDMVAIEVTLSQGQAQTNKRIALESCRQRESVFFGQRKPDYEEANWLDGSGQLVGCAFTGDWWIRVQPLFGVPPRGAAPFGNPYDGYVEEDGKFSFFVRYGVRHLMIVGKDADPVKVFAVNLDYASGSDLGEFDLSGSCPIDSR